MEEKQLSVCRLVLGGEKTRKWATSKEQKISMVPQEVSTRENALPQQDFAALVPSRVSTRPPEQTYFLEGVQLMPPKLSTRGVRNPLSQCVPSSETQEFALHLEQAQQEAR